MKNDELYRRIAMRERLALAEAALSRVTAVGHGEDCLFCGLKDRQVAVYEETLEQRGLGTVPTGPAPAEEGM